MHSHPRLPHFYDGLCLLECHHKKNYVMHASRFRTGCPKDFVFAEINNNFIQYSCTIVPVRVLLAVWVHPKLILFTMNTVDSAQICSL
jgi:hypothetical protein